jgi:hypothetical protein
MISNELKKPLDDFFNRLRLLYGFLFHLQNQLNNFSDLFRKSVDESDFDISDIGAGARLVIRDLIEMSETEEEKLLPLRGFVTRGEEYLELKEVLIHRESAWTTSQGYEAFETFLFDMLATFLFENPQSANLSKLQKFEEKKGKGLKPQDLSYWGKYVRYTYRGNGNRKVFKRIKNFASVIEEIEEESAWGFDLSRWYSVATTVRHAITHSNAKIRRADLQNWSQEKKELLERLFPGHYSEGAYLIEMKAKDVKIVFKLFAEYAYVIFRGLSQRIE